MKLERSLFLLKGAAGILTTAFFLLSPAPVNSQSWNATEEDIKSLIIMIDVTLKNGPRRGAGIICGVGGDSLYIATANHVVREGKKEAAEIKLQFKWLPDKPVRANLLPHFDAKLDYTVLRVSGLKELKINPEDLPFDRLGSPDSLRRGDEIYLLGYPGGIPWRINTKRENFAGSRGDSLEFESNLITGGHSGGRSLMKTVT
jgi:S1-C subfamily serine protease